MTDSQPTSSAPVTSPPEAKLAAKMAHELNNPLDAVLRLVSLAQRKAKTGDYSDLDRHLADAQFGLERMAEILRELMEIGRQSQEALPRQMPLDELISQALRTITSLAEQKHVALQVEFDLSSELAVRHDLRLSQVLANLLKNALDASPENSTVHLRTSVDGDGLKIAVEDSGPGIDSQFLPRLFTPFVTSKPQGKGHGLGLAISRELVVAMGGTLSVANRAGGGCIATICLPLR
jgi:signal transduction histidine kinase